MRHSFEMSVIDKVRAYFEQHYADELTVLGTRVALWKRKRLPAVPLQPDIDILWSPTTARRLMAVETKAVRLRLNAGASLTAAYYDGVDEALALLRFGVDSATLFQVFLIPGTSDEQRDAATSSFVAYQKAVVDLIKTLSLPIGYRAAFDVLVDGELTDGPLKVLQVGSEDRFLIQPQPNPYLSEPSDHPCHELRSRLLDIYGKAPSE